MLIYGKILKESLNHLQQYHKLKYKTPSAREWFLKFKQVSWVFNIAAIAFDLGTSYEYSFSFDHYQRFKAVTLLNRCVVINQTVVITM